MQKTEYLYWVEWIKIRWPNTKMVEKSIISLYKDFEIYSDDVFGKCLLEYFDQGHEFINWSDIKKRCRELQVEEYSQFAQKKALEKKAEEYELDRPTGLGAYLKTQGWNSLAEAVFYTSKRLYKRNELYKPSQKAFAEYANMDFNEATEQGWKLGLIDSVL